MLLKLANSPFADIDDKKISLKLRLIDLLTMLITNIISASLGGALLWGH
ncbi:unnamed protein product, partial [Strongylus vulgaris]